MRYDTCKAAVAAAGATADKTGVVMAVDYADGGGYRVRANRQRPEPGDKYAKQVWPWEDTR